MKRNKYNVNTCQLLFDWNEEKSRRNKQKHGLSFEDAKHAFSDENALLIHDLDHSEEESRFVLLGLDSRFGLLVVSHAYREDDRIIRIISARRASRREAEQYWLRWRK
jgi:hypothetical protein